MACSRSRIKVCGTAEEKIRKQLATMERMRSGTIVFDEAVATMKSAAQALKSSFQCMNCIVTLHHPASPERGRGREILNCKHPAVNPVSIASLAGTLHPN